MLGRVLSGRPVSISNSCPADKPRRGWSGLFPPTEPFQLFIPGLDHLPPVSLPDYWIDQREVTNRDFQRFVDDGGYRREDLWREPFVKDGRPMAFQAQSRSSLTRPGRPGPATWEQGMYPAGQDDYPVTGVSWYEAAAYARWAGKSLPTIYHWSRAADQRLSGNVVPASNFSGKGPLPVGRVRRPHPRRHDRHGWQRERVVLEQRGGEALHPRAAPGTNPSTCSPMPMPSRRSRASRPSAFAA